MFTDTAEYWIVTDHSLIKINMTRPKTAHQSKGGLASTVLIRVYTNRFFFERTFVKKKISVHSTAWQMSFERIAKRI